MEKNRINFSKLVTNFLINFASVFAILIIIICSISEYIYSDMILLKDIVTIGVFSFISSIIFMLIFSLNKIGVVTQYLLVYCFLSLVILLLGYFLYIYDFVYNSKLLFVTIICMIVGLIGILVYGYLKNKKVDNSLNANLKNFKERDK